MGAPDTRPVDAGRAAVEDSMGLWPGWEAADDRESVARALAAIDGGFTSAGEASVVNKASLSPVEAAWFGSDLAGPVETAVLAGTSAGGCAMSGERCGVRGTSAADAADAGPVRERLVASAATSLCAGADSETTRPAGRQGAGLETKASVTCPSKAENTCPDGGTAAAR